jgi:hypothetical protein
VAAYLEEKACKPKPEEGKAGEVKGVLAKLWSWARGGVRKQEHPPEWWTTAQALARHEAGEACYQWRSAFLDSVGSILDAAPEAEKAALLRVSVEQFVTGLSEALATAAGASAGAEVEAAATKLRQAVASDLSGLAKREALAAGVAALDTARVVWHGVKVTPTVSDKELTMDQPPSPPPATLTPEERIAQLEAELAALRAAAEAAKAEAAKAEAAKVEKAKQTEAACLAKAQALAVPGADAAKVAEVLKRVAADAALTRDVEELFSALSAQVRKAGEVLTSTVGATGAGSDPASPEAKLERLAADVRKANPKITKAAAYVQALEANPDLYKESLAAR